MGFDQDSPVACHTHAVCWVGTVAAARYFGAVELLLLLSLGRALLQLETRPSRSRQVTPSRATVQYCRTT